MRNNNKKWLGIGIFVIVLILSILLSTHLFSLTSTPSYSQTLKVDSCSDSQAAVVVVNDISASMAGSKITKAAEATKLVFDKLDANDWAGYITYSYGVATKKGLTQDKSSLKNSVRTSVYGTTCIACGLDGAINMLKAFDKGEKAIVLMTDGQANRCIGGKFCDITTAKNQVIQEAQLAKNYGIKVYTVAYGSDADKSLMQEAAIAGGGKYYAADELNIKDVYLDILKDAAAPGASVKTYNFNGNFIREEFKNIFFLSPCNTGNGDYKILCYKNGIESVLGEGKVNPSQTKNLQYNKSCDRVKIIITSNQPTLCLGTCSTLTMDVALFESECSGTQTMCSGSSLYSCNNGVWKFSKECESGVCVNGGCGQCNPTKTPYKCESNTLYKCGSNYLWSPIKNCGSGTCDLSLKGCRYCKDGDTQCNGLNYQLCSNGQWKTQKTCSYECSKDLGCITCTIGDKKCVGDYSYNCVNGVWSVKNCGNDGCSGGECNPHQIVCGDGLVEGSEQCELSQTKPCSINDHKGIMKCVDCKWSECALYPYCGDGKCDKGENSYNCEVDCGKPPAQFDLSSLKNEYELNKPITITLSTKYITPDSYIQMKIITDDGKLVQARIGKWIDEKNVEFNFDPLTKPGIYNFDLIYAPEKVNVKHSFTIKQQLVAELNPADILQSTAQPNIEFSLKISPGGLPVNKELYCKYKGLFSILSGYKKIDAQFIPVDYQNGIYKVDADSSQFKNGNYVCVAKVEDYNGYYNPAETSTSFTIQNSFLKVSINAPAKVKANTINLIYVNVLGLHGIPTDVSDLKLDVIYPDAVNEESVNFERFNKVEVGKYVVNYNFTEGGAYKIRATAYKYPYQPGTSDLITVGVAGARTSGNEIVPNAPTQSSGFPIWILVVGGIVITSFIIIIMVIRKRRK